MEENQVEIIPQTSDTKKRNAIIIAAAIIISGIAAYYIFSKKEKSTTIAASVKDSATVKKDTTQAPHNSDDVPYYDGEDPYGVYYFVQDVISGGRQFHFGDKVFKDYQKSAAGNAVVYLSEPDFSKPITQQAYNIPENLVVYESELEDYKKNFSLQPFVSLDLKTKKLILDKDYSEGIDYSITQNAERAKNTICYGDFDEDGLNDVAVILDNNEQQKSRLLIICTNAATAEKYLAFAENYSDKVKVNAFKKGAFVAMNEETSEGLTTAPIDGIILKGEDLKLAIMYNKQLQKFKTWYQE